MAALKYKLFNNNWIISCICTQLFRNFALLCYGSDKLLQMNKKLIPHKIGLIAGMLFALNAWGQKGLYLKPSAGIGFSYKKEEKNLFDIQGVKTGPLAPVNVTAGIGYHVKKWRVETGIGYSRTGVKHEFQNVFASPEKGLIYDTANAHTYFHHIIIPLRIAYQFRMNRKLSLYPTLGGAVSFNMGTTDKLIYNQNTSANRNRTSLSFPPQLRPVTLLGEAQLNATYKVSKNIDVFGGPALQYMINPVSRSKGDVGKSASDTYPYNIMINAGLNWYLPTNKAAADTPGK